MARFYPRRSALSAGPRVSEPIVLVHSPICGPYSWQLVADELGRRGREVLVPPIDADEKSKEPFWKQHARGAADAIDTLPTSAFPILVGHSGAGLLLPPIRELSGRPVAAYIFADAGLPDPLVPRKGAKDGSFARQLEAIYAAGDRYPNWTAAALGIADIERSERVVREQRSQPLAYWEECVPVFEGWPDAPCGYLHFSAGYEADASEARNRGWACVRIEGRHFLPVIDPLRVMDGLVQVLEQIGVS